MPFKGFLILSDDESIQVTKSKFPYHIEDISVKPRTGINIRKHGKTEELINKIVRKNPFLMVSNWIVCIDDSNYVYVYSDEEPDKNLHLSIGEIVSSMSIKD